jgi:hypothetical protein
MSPDWSAKAATVPYVSWGNPQSLNLYAYVGNDPISGEDPDGHLTFGFGDGTWDNYGSDGVAEHQENMLQDAEASASAQTTEATQSAVETTTSLIEKVSAKMSATASGALDAAVTATDTVISDAIGTIAGAVAIPFMFTQSTAGPKDDELHDNRHFDAPADMQPQTAAGGAGARQGGNGRGGRQARLKDLANDPKVNSAHTGWLKNEQRHVKNGNRSSLRNPPGTELAHRRGQEARKGYDYSHSDLQEKSLHTTQHRIEREYNQE